MDHEDILSALNRRYATKLFDPTKKLDEKTLATLIEAMRLAPSSNGLQMRGFVIVTDPATREKLRAAAYDQKQIIDASHLIVICRKTHIDESAAMKHIQRMHEVRGTSWEDLEKHKASMVHGIERRTPEERPHWASRQVYIPLGFFLETAALLHIDACPMEGFEPAKFDDILGLEKLGLASVVLAAVGYRSADDKYAAMKKVRFPVEQVIFRI